MAKMIMTDSGEVVVPPMSSDAEWVQFKHRATTPSGVVVSDGQFPMPPQVFAWTEGEEDEVAAQVTGITEDGFWLCTEGPCAEAVLVRWAAGYPVTLRREVLAVAGVGAALADSGPTDVGEDAEFFFGPNPAAA